MGCDGKIEPHVQDHRSKEALSYAKTKQVFFVALSLILENYAVASPLNE